MIDNISRIMKIIKKLIDEKYTGEIMLKFNCGGIRAIKKIKSESIEF